MKTVSRASAQIRADALGSPTTQLALRLARFAPLAPDELPMLTELTAATRVFRGRQDIVIEGRKHRAVLLVVDGILVRYRILRSGQRQIVNFAVPGDFAGIPGCLFDGALNSIRALTDATVSIIPLTQLVALFRHHPRLAAKLLWAFSCEAAVYAERLVSIARRSATERVAHFLLELLYRLQIAGMAEERSYRIPLSQEMIGDALGLSVPYVNRVLRQLADDSLVTIKDRQVVIEDVPALADLAEFDPAYLIPLSMLDITDGHGASINSNAAP